VIEHVFHLSMIAVTGSATHHASSAAKRLLVAGGLCLFASVAMWMRTGMARGSGKPIPDDPAADKATKLVRAMGRGERARVPLYTRMTQGFAILGLALLVTAGVVFLVSR